MIACVDVAYEHTSAVAAAVAIRAWTDSAPSESATTHIREVRNYRPGFFYERELPCILDVLAQLASSPRYILIDGYAWLGPDRPGLGAHLYELLDREPSVIGVAKSPFAGNTVAAQLRRGQSTRPLFVTACGVEVDAAVEYVRAMHGAFRIPTIIRYVDSLARGSARQQPVAGQAP